MGQFKTKDALREYIRLEEKLGFSIGAQSIYLREKWMDSEFFQRTKHIALTAGLKTKFDLRSHLFHECFHALIRHYKIPKSFFNSFSSGVSLGYSKKEIQFMDEANEPAPEGFISTYAMTHWEEDAAETFAAFLVNGSRVSGYVDYEGYRSNLNKDKKLKQKFVAIQGMIDFIRRNG